MKEKILQVDELQVAVYPNRDTMGKAAAEAVAERMKIILSQQAGMRMIFAAAPSQNEFLNALIRTDGIDWSRITAFHMDDYLGLADNSPQRFSTYLMTHLFDRVSFKEVHYLLEADSPLTQKKPVSALSGDITETCRRYSDLLAEEPIDIVCMGIGENGHIAFNDPPVADFEDSQSVKLVELEERCRIQQVHDGCFEQLGDVPTHALTLTIPALTGAKWLFCMVPGLTKREAVRRTLSGPIGRECPATVLRQHQGALLFLDEDAASGL